MRRGGLVSCRVVTWNRYVRVNLLWQRAWMPYHRLGDTRRRVLWLIVIGFFLFLVAVYFTLYLHILKKLDEFSAEDDGPLDFVGSDDHVVDYFNSSEVRIRRPGLGDTIHQLPNYESRSGFGEYGKPFPAPQTEEESRRLDEDMEKWFMNVHASDQISLDRALYDQRSEACKALRYADDDFPTASVVVIFTDEAWSTLLRTVHSVVNRTPSRFLKEIVLVDDFSQREELKQKLEEYLVRFDELVRLIRSRERLGLIRAKLAGASFARGDVIVFLDSHCEATQGWIEPLLARIKEKRSAVVCPVIDMIGDRDMQYAGGSLGGIGTFWWSLHYKMDPIPEREVRRRLNPETDYLNSPTMAGGLFAVDRRYFFEVGGYDPRMDIWGGENLEISFRVWMCGGSVEILPCSHVGHIYRNGHPYNMTGKDGNLDVHGTNSRRLAEVWMDDYKRLFYVHRMGLKDADDGDLHERKALRQRLKCNSFKWYLDNVIPEKFIPDENVKAYGMVRSESDDGATLCLDTLQRLENKGAVYLGVFHCQSGGSSSQMFSWSNDRQLRRETTCVDTDHLPRPDGRLRVVLKECSPDDVSDFHHSPNGPLKHLKTELCLDTYGISSGDDVFLAKCANITSQKWSFIGKYF